jgi:hypothetical protein
MNHSYRAPIYGGGMNVPGAPGNLGGYAGLPETINEIERREQEYQRKKFEYDMNPENQPQPYNPETNPVFPNYPFGRPTGTGGFATLPYYGGVQQLAADPSFQIPPTPQQLENRRNFNLFNDPRFPGARRTRHLIEDTLKLPRTPFAQGLPMGFQNKYVS